MILTDNETKVDLLKMWGIPMKHALLVLLHLCTVLTLPAFAQDNESPNHPALITPPIFKPWKGDLDGMVQRRIIRALVAPSRTSYWLNGARQTGAEYELLKAFQEEINNQYQKHAKHIRIHVVFIPTSREQLIPGLLEGRGDIAAGHLDRHTGAPWTGRFWRAVLSRRQGNRGDGTGLSRAGLRRRSFGQ